MRRALLAIGAAAALAVALPTSASAQHWGGHWGGHHFGFGGPGISFGFGVSPYSAYDYDYGPDCYRVQRVWTQWGPRLRRVWVC
jgi:hypothetical protein